MKLLFYRYNSICEPDLIEAFQASGFEVMEECYEIKTKLVAPATRIKIIEKHFNCEKPQIVFSINFFPDIAEICHIYSVPYLCWTVDSPVPELFSRAITYDTSHIFLFDYEQYLRFSPYNPDRIQYLPLGANVRRFDRVVSSITTKERTCFHHDISFVGSLYTEKSPIQNVSGISEYTKGFIHGIATPALKLYGINFIEPSLTTQVIHDIKSHAPNFYHLPDAVEEMDAYVVAHQYVGNYITEAERIQTLNLLASKFDVHLYTRSDTSSLTNVKIHNGVDSLSTMPKILHLSKINLNMTSKPIISGLPLRIFDIMGCGGFVMSNYQYEIPEYFEIGIDLETYGSMEELVDKCSYYLSHEEQRKQIALNGHEKVCANHTYYHRIAKMLKTMM
ncbi:MAG: glycosyltransferase [Lachnospiraceae bacterium]|nr:glycosyltransferase [Lachnospiraceae bacterium]